jgi:hypothetical protein
LETKDEKKEWANKESSHIKPKDIEMSQETLLPISAETPETAPLIDTTKIKHTTVDRSQVKKPECNQQ